MSSKNKDLTGKTTHELARELLALPDTKVLHHYHYHGDFDDEGTNHYSKPEVDIDNGVVYITDGEYVGCRGEGIYEDSGN